MFKLHAALYSFAVFDIDNPSSPGLDFPRTYFLPQHFRAPRVQNRPDSLVFAFGSHQCEAARPANSICALYAVGRPKWVSADLPPAADPVLP